MGGWYALPDRFEEQVRRYPEQPAVRSRTHQSTYHELNVTANRIARATQARGRSDDAPIALLLEQGESLFAHIMGVLKSGGFFLPLDPRHPTYHTRYLLEDSRTNLILTNNRNAALAAELAGDSIQLLNVDEIDASLPGEDLGMAISPDAIANILYTSTPRVRPGSQKG